MKHKYFEKMHLNPVYRTYIYFIFFLFQMYDVCNVYHSHLGKVLTSAANTYILLRGVRGREGGGGVAYNDNL